ncbi:MAG: hypothetical protein CME64_16510 [Halobacteriovoraceae bacterium]|nr:hypothetical protein [Halobacteriovoraceae bacterium]|tara:strand:+ start:131922 stop:132749 length:828 start_codon:yes stop_codon:yes gene_type:complete
MVKYFIFLAMLSLSAFAQNETKEYLAVKKVIEKTRIQEFGEFVASIKKGAVPEPTNPYSPDSALSLKEESFYKSFDLFRYQSGLIKQLMHNFETSELEEIERFYSNPFNAKILTHLNTDAFLVGAYKRLDQAKLSKLSKNRAKLLQKVLNLHKLNLLVVDQKNELSKELYRKKELLAILETADTTEVGRDVERLEDIYKQFSFYTLKYLGNKFEDYQDTELKEIARIMTSKPVQKAAQLIVSYHYYFLKNAKREFDRTYVPDKDIKLKQDQLYIK